jgi:hypothetical protein
MGKYLIIDGKVFAVERKGRITTRFDKTSALKRAATAAGVDWRKGKITGDKPKIPIRKPTPPKPRAKPKPKPKPKPKAKPKPKPRPKPKSKPKPKPKPKPKAKGVKVSPKGKWSKRILLKTLFYRATYIEDEKYAEPRELSRKIKTYLNFEIVINAKNKTDFMTQLEAVLLEQAEIHFTVNWQRPPEKIWSVRGVYQENKDWFYMKYKRLTQTTDEKVLSYLRRN